MSKCQGPRTAARPIPEGMTIFCLVALCIVAKQYVLAKNCLKERIGNQGQRVDFLGRHRISTSGSPIWPPRRLFLPYGRPNLALAGILVYITCNDVL